MRFSLMLCAIVAAMTAGAIPAPAQPVARPTPDAGRSVPRIITVHGEGKVEAVPDVVDIVTGVLTRDKSARAAVDRNSEAMGGLMDALHRAGIAGKDIRTSEFSLAPEYTRAQHNQPRELVGYLASNQVTVTIRDTKRLGDVIDRVVSAGSNRISGIRFRVSDPEKLVDRARRLAVADARRRAELFASAAGVSVGRVLRLQEGGSRGPQPRMMTAAAMTTSRMVPVSAGTQEIVAAVSVQYELR